MGHFRPKTAAHKVRFGSGAEKAQNEQMSSGLHPNADKQQTYAARSRDTDFMTGLLARPVAGARPLLTAYPQMPLARSDASF
jgi:hypothetical protein